jgi:type IV secretion system protein TrbC
MRRILSRGLSVATATCSLFVAAPAFAGGTGMPWESPLQQIVQSITGPVVQAAAIVAVVLFGSGIAVSESGSAMRRGLGILFGLSIAFAASTFFLDFFGFAGGVEIG